MSIRILLLTAFLATTLVGVTLSCGDRNEKNILTTATTKTDSETLPLTKALEKLAGDLSVTGEVRLAVYPLVSAEGNETAAGHYLATILPVTIKQVRKDWNLYTRRYLNQIATEQGLASSDFFSAEGRIKLGKLVGANRLLSGTIIAADSVWEIILTLVDTTTGEELAAARVFASVDAQTLKLVKKLSSETDTELPSGTYISANAEVADWEARGDLLFDQMDYPTSLDAYQVAYDKADGEDRARLAFKLAYVAHQHLDKPDLAIKMYTESLASGSFPKAANNRAMIYLDRGELKSALVDMEAAIKAMPKQAGFHYNLGLVLLALGYESRAASSFDTAISLDSKYAAAYDGKARAMIDAGKPSEAIQAAEMAVKLDNKNALYVARLAATYMLSSRFKDAVGIYEKALELDDQNAQIWLDAGKCYEATGAITKAIEAYQKAMNLDSNLIEARDRLTLLKLNM